MAFFNEQQIESSSDVARTYLHVNFDCIKSCVSTQKRMALEVGVQGKTIYNEYFFSFSSDISYVANLYHTYI